MRWVQSWVDFNRLRDCLSARDDHGILAFIEKEQLFDSKIKRATAEDGFVIL